VAIALESEEREAELHEQELGQKEGEEGM